MVKANTPVITYVTINGIDVTSYVTAWTMEEEWGEVIGSLQLSVSKRIDTVIDLSGETPHHPIVVQRGPTTGQEYSVFQGYLVDHSITNRGYSLQCMDKYYEAIQREANTSWDRDIDPEQGVVSEIYKTLLQTYTSLTVDSTSVQDSGTVFTLGKFVANHAEVFERAESLANARNWQHYYDSRTDKAYFEPKGFVSETTVLTVGDNVLNRPVWSVNKSKMYNTLTVIGAERDTETVEFFDGDGTTSKYTLTYTPSSMKVYVGSTNFDPLGTGTRPSDTPSNLEEGGRAGSTTGTYNYEYDDDPKVRSINFETGSIPSNNTNSIEVQYTYKLPAPVLVKSVSSIDTYGIIEKTIVKDDIKSVADAEVFGRAQLEKFYLPFVSTTLLVTGIEDIRVGRVYQCVDDDNSIDRFLIVTEIKRQYPYKPDELTVGDEIIKTADFETTVLDRIKRLEEKEGKTTDLLVQVLDYEDAFYPQRRCAYFEKASIAGDTLIWGNSTYGIWNSYNWGSDANASYILGSSLTGVLGVNTLGDQNSAFESVQVLQGNNDYREFFYDDRFIDTSNSTATLDMTNRRFT